jgi:hypothetical protein
MPAAKHRPLPAGAVEGGAGDGQAVGHGLHSAGKRVTRERSPPPTRLHSAGKRVTRHKIYQLPTRALRLLNQPAHACLTNGERAPCI